MCLILLCFIFIQIITSLPTKDIFSLSKVDNLIYEKLTNPVPGEGEAVLETIYMYNQALNKTIQAYMQDKTGQDVVDILIQQKGPKFITPFIDDHKLQAVYEWEVKELGELYYMLCGTKMLWRDFRYYLVTKLGYDIAPMPLFFTTTISSTE